MSDDNSVATLGCVWGESKYFDMMDAWLASISALNKRPDQIVIATTFDKVEVVKQKSNSMQIDIVSCDELCIEEMINVAAKAVKTKWISILAMDDRFLPNAYDVFNIVPQDVDVVSIGMRTTLGVDIPARPVENLWSGSRTMILGPSYIKKYMWDKVGGYDKRYKLSDWALWVMAARAGANFWTSPDITHLIDINSPGRISSDQFAESEYKKIDILRETGCYSE